MVDSVYYLIEKDPALSFCEDWRQRWLFARKATADFVRAHGATGWRMNHFSDTISSMSVPAEIPEGWRVYKARRRGERDLIAPIKGKKGAAARAAIEALPKHPNQEEIADFLNFPQKFEYEGPDTKGWDSFSGFRFHNVQLFFPSRSGPMFLETVDVEEHIRLHLLHNPDHTILSGHWDRAREFGLKKISKNEKNFLMAQEELKVEKNGG